MWARRRELYDRAIGSKVPSQNGNSCVRFEGSGEGVDYVAVPARGVGDILPDHLAVGGQRVTAQCARLSKLAQNCRESSCVKIIFHQIFARWLQIYQAWQFGSESFKIVQAKRHA